jgi:general secretion pathway protein K
VSGGKIFRAPARVRSRSGLVLAVVLWLLIILTVLVVGLGRRASLELALTGFRRDQFVSRIAAISGLMYSEALIKQERDEEKVKGAGRDAKENPEDVYGKVKTSSGHFDVKYDVEGDGQWRFGPVDEFSRINLNAITIKTRAVLKELIMGFGYENDLAETIASSVIDWLDTDSTVLNEPFGAENEYYAGLDQPYLCKNRSFDSVDELLLVRGVEEDLFGKIKPYLTALPAEGRFLINFEMASRRVLTALATSLTGGMTNSAPEDAESLVEKMVSCRNGKDGIAGTEDDQMIVLNEMELNPKETALFETMSSFRADQPGPLRVEVDGYAPGSTRNTHLVAVVDRENFSVLFWERH